MERETRLELATFCMASRCSTNWATPAYFIDIPHFIFYNSQLPHFSFQVLYTFRWPGVRFYLFYMESQRNLLKTLIYWAISLMELDLGFEPRRAKPTAYKTVPIDHYGNPAYFVKKLKYISHFLLPNIDDKTFQDILHCKKEPQRISL